MADAIARSAADGVGPRGPSEATGSRARGIRRPYRLDTLMSVDAPPASITEAESHLMAGRLEPALRSYASLLSVAPADPQVQHGLAVTLKVLGHPQRAEPLLRAAAAATGDAEMLRNHGVLSLELGGLEAAALSFSQALASDPGDAVSAAHLAEAQLGLTRYDEALAAAEHAVDLDPDLTLGWYGVATASAHLCRVEARERAAAELWPRLERELRASPHRSRLPLLGALLLGAPSDLQKEMVRRCAANHASRVLPPPPPRPRGSRLRVGYLSADLWDHAVGFLFAPFLEAHDADRVETHLFSLRDVVDPTQARLRQAATHWHDLSRLDDDAAAGRIRAAGIDVLVDLGGLTRGARPSILGRRPAPVQLHWLGYPGTLGRSLVDAQLTHRARDPEGSERAYDEELVRVEAWLATGGWDFGPCPTRAELGLPEDAFLFAYFSAAYRIDRDLMRAWAEILTAVPEGVMWLPDYGPTPTGNLRRELARHGVAPKRVYFTPLGKLSDDGRHRLADLWLDAFSPSGGTAAVLAAWSGIPVLTRAGDRPQDRTGTLVAHLAGVPELAVSSSAAYVESAIALARAPARRRALSERLLRREGPLFRPRAAAAEFEALYHRLRDARLAASRG